MKPKIGDFIYDYAGRQYFEAIGINLTKEDLPDTSAMLPSGEYCVGRLLGTEDGDVTITIFALSEMNKTWEVKD